MSDESTSLDELLDLLTSARRRYVLYLLAENEHANVQNLAVQIAAWEDDVSLREVSDDRHDRVVLDLFHNHLPRLADDHIVEFDRRSGDIVRGGSFESIEEVVERVRALDDESDVESETLRTLLVE